MVPVSSFDSAMSATPPTSSPLSSSRYPHVAIAPLPSTKPSVRIPLLSSPARATPPSRSLATAATRRTSLAPRSECAAPETLPATPPSVRPTRPGAVVERGETEWGDMVMSTARTPATTSEAGGTEPVGAVEVDAEGGEEAAAGGGEGGGEGGSEGWNDEDELDELCRT